MSATAAGFALVGSPDGAAIAYEARGDGPPVVLVGGALSTRSFFEPLVEALANRFTAITFDRRGRGDSRADGPYAVDREIEDLAAIIDHFGGSCAVYGHSSGGILALRALVAGVAISRLAIYEPPIFTPSHPRVGTVVSAVRSLLTEGRRGDAVEYFLREIARASPQSIERVKASSAWPTFESVAHTLDYDIAVSGSDGTDPMPPLGGIAIPVLALDGGQSSVEVRAITAAVADAVPNARHATIADERHNPSIDAIAPVLVGFFTTKNL